jgi:hypothetical protein
MSWQSTLGRTLLLLQGVGIEGAIQTRGHSGAKSYAVNTRASGGEELAVAQIYAGCETVCLSVLFTLAFLPPPQFNFRVDCSEIQTKSVRRDTYSRELP